jgi:hypothetical protein
MATTTPNFGWTVPTSTDLVKDGATAIETLGDGIDASFVGLKGGTTGQVLSKTSGTDLAFTWVAQDDSNAIQNAIVDAKGDLIGATAADTPARLAVGTNGQVLTADSTAATGLKWADAAGGGKVLQVVTATLVTTASTTSTTFTDTGLSASITPAATSSRILVIATICAGVTGSASSNYSLFRDTTNLLTPTSPSNRNPSFMQYPGDISGSTYFMIPATYNFVDSPSSTSSLTYKIRYLISSPGTAYINRTATDGDTASYSRGVSSITLLEIGA